MARGRGRWRVRLATGVLAGVGLGWSVGMVGGAPMAGAADPGTLRFPTEADAVAYAAGAETILFGPGGVETRLPGPVDDHEDVRVDLGIDGAPVAVTVDQTLTVHGLGDFEFKVPGPASTVDALPESEAEPGLRRGAALWQGFSPGTKVLAARMALYPELEASRLPMSVALRATVGGAPLEDGAAQSGPLELVVVLTNTTAFPVRIAEGAADPVVVAGILDRLRDDLANGRRPAPGEGGIPASVQAADVTEGTNQTVEAGVAFDLTVSFPTGTVSGLTVEGGQVQGGGSVVRATGVVGAGRASATTITVRGTATRLDVPDLTLEAAAALPDPAAVAPPSGGSWTEAVAADPGAADGRAMTALAMRTLWAVAWLRQVDAYLGNPDPTGPASTSYVYRLNPAAGVIAPAPTAPPPSGPQPWAIVGWTALGMVTLAGLAVLWANA
jgi:hypothetical protein